MILGFWISRANEAWIENTSYRADGTKSVAASICSNTMYARRIWHVRLLEIVLSTQYATARIKRCQMESLFSLPDRE